jgi:hypothetical protein
MNNVDFPIEVLQNRLDLLSKQVIGIDKCKCNKDVDKQMDIRKKIQSLNDAIYKLKNDNKVTIKVTDNAQIRYL